MEKAEVARLGLLEDLPRQELAHRGSPGLLAAAANTGEELAVDMVVMSVGGMRTSGS